MDPNANIIFGALVDESMNGEIAITVIATGFPVMSTADALSGNCHIRESCHDKSYNTIAQCLSISVTSTLHECVSMITTLHVCLLPCPCPVFVLEPFTLDIICMEQDGTAKHCLIIA